MVPILSLGLWSLGLSRCTGSCFYMRSSYRCPWAQPNGPGMHSKHNPCNLSAHMSLSEASTVPGHARSLIPAVQQIAHMSDATVWSAAVGARARCPGTEQVKHAMRASTFAALVERLAPRLPLFIRSSDRLTPNFTWYNSQTALSAPIRRAC